MKKRLAVVLCLITVLALSLLVGIQSTASQPPAAPPIPVELTPIPEPPLDAGVPVTIFPSTHWGSDSLQEDTVVGIAKNAFQLFSDEAPYRKANVKVLYSDAGEPESLIVYLLHKDTYLFETAKITLGEDYSVASVETDYVEQGGDFQEPIHLASCPDESVQMVFSTCCTGIPTAVAAIERAGEIAEEAGYTYRVLLGSQENVSAIQDWLSCENLIAFGRVGHGNPTGIMLADYTLSYTWFESLSPTALNGKTLYFNSCRVHNPPLKTAILGAGVQRYIGGIDPLLIGASEEVFKCFWDAAMLDQAEMHPTLFSCEETHYPYTGAHGIAPDTGSDVLPPPQLNTCVINLEEDWHSCWFVPAIDFVLEPNDHKTVFKVNLDPAQSGYTTAVFDVEYGQQPTDYTVNIGDSQSNNGWGGDSVHQSNDAEMQIWNTTLGVWGNDNLTIMEVRNMLNLYDIVSQGDTIPIEVSNYYLGWGGGELRSQYLYALDGQPDSEGPVNYDIYAAFNRTIYSAGRDGSGVTEVTVTLHP